MWSVAQFDTLRLQLIKVAARVVEMKTIIRVHLATSCPGQDILRLVLGRIPRLDGGLAPRMSRPSRQPANILHSNFWFVAADASAGRRSSAASSEPWPMARLRHFDDSQRDNTRMSGICILYYLSVYATDT
jgi:hypothetical protein